MDAGMMLTMCRRNTMEYRHRMHTVMTSGFTSMRVNPVRDRIKFAAPGNSGYIEKTNARRTLSSPCRTMFTREIIQPAKSIP